MKLYYHVKKRIAKGYLGKRWKKLQRGASLKPGDLVHTCDGFNDFIKTVEPAWLPMSSRTRRSLRTPKAEVIVDFDITTEDGGSCSWVHCCTDPPPSVEEIENYFRRYLTTEGRAHLDKMDANGWDTSKSRKLAARLEQGLPICDELGRELRDG